MSEDKIQIMRHSCAHLVAAAVQELYPEAKFGVGPVVENGFYYDIDFPKTISETDLAKIEARAMGLAKKGVGFEREEMPLAEAIKFFKKIGQVYKVELLNDLKKKGTTKVKDENSKGLSDSVDTVSLYRTGEFVDLCRGPHLKSAKDIGVFKLTKLAGAYWRGNEKNKMLTRIYGVDFETKAELDNYLKMQEEAEKRDHRKLGKELGLFVFSDLVGPGLPLYTFKGALIRREIINFTNELQKGIGYQEVHTPNMNKAELFKISGHYDKYKDGMFRVVSNYTEEEYFLKPMNCPHHTQIYASQMHSYKDLPVRIADFANLYRDEKPGELSGLTRLRCFAQDDGHCFCREDQIKEEFLNILKIIKICLDTYKMNYKIRLSLWDPEHQEKYLGEPAVWEKSQKLLKEILKENKIEHSIGIGEAAIYGPKMDLISTDSLGREWQISTIQIDFIMPQRFQLSYIDADGKEKTPVMIHRAIIGSPERFLGILIEHYAGAFPTWLSPVQVMLIPVSENHADGAEKISEELKKLGVRVSLDAANETLGNRVRKAVGQKVPYIVVVGDKEIAGEDWMIRVRGVEKQEKMSKEAFLKRLKKEIDEKLA